MNRTRGLKTERQARGRAAARRCAGLTLVELLLSLAITATIAASVAGMLSALAYGTDAGRDVRALVARQKMVTARFEAAVRGSRMVLATGDTASGAWLVLWTRDLDEDGLPSLQEIRLLEHDAASETLSSFVAAEGATDAEYGLGDDFDAITHGLKATEDFPATRWGNGVTELGLTLDRNTAQDARRVSYRLSFSAGRVTEVAVGTARLSNGYGAGG
ncbi:MAG: prepilin-type N-terminal cleavage/methylation domain-containing protein [Planctomycetota bacterium]